MSDKRKAPLSAFKRVNAIRNKPEFLHTLAGFPKQIGTYFEPAVGGGCVALHLLGLPTPPDRVIIGDINPDVIAAWRAIQRHPNLLVMALERLNSRLAAIPSRTKSDLVKRKAFHRAVRDNLTVRENFLRPSGDHHTTLTIERAARFIFVQASAFMRMPQYNLTTSRNLTQSNKFVKPVDVQEIRDVSALIQAVTIIEGDFEDTLFPSSNRHAPMGKNDVVYTDLPFTKSGLGRGMSSSQVEYTPDDRVRLAGCLKDAAKLDAYCVAADNEGAGVYGGSFEYAGPTPRTGRAKNLASLYVYTPEGS